MQPWIANGYFLSAVFVLVGVYVGLPARWWPVDAGAALVVAALCSAGLALSFRSPLARRVAGACAWVLLIVGAATLTALVWTATYLTGVYGPIGDGGALILGTVAALVLPYLVLLPALHLAALRRLS